LVAVDLGIIASKVIGFFFKWSKQLAKL